MELSLLPNYATVCSTLGQSFGRVVFAYPKLDVRWDVVRVGSAKARQFVLTDSV